MPFWKWFQLKISDWGRDANKKYLERDLTRAYSATGQVEDDLAPALDGTTNHRKGNC
jgi:hypothetical protein